MSLPEEVERLLAPKQSVNGDVSVAQLRIAFDLFIDRDRPGEEQTVQLLRYIKGLKERSLVDGKNVKTEIFLGALTIIGHTALFRFGKKESESQDFINYNLCALLQARKDIQDNIPEYLLRDANKTATKHYSRLEGIFNRAGNILSDYSSLIFWRGNNTRHHLKGMLAEHQVVQALKLNGYPYTRYSSVSEDANEAIDVIVPVDGLISPSIVPLQVKSSESLSISFRKQGQGVREVIVPMSLELDQFCMSSQNTEKLLEAVEEQKQRVLQAT